MARRVRCKATDQADVRYDYDIVRCERDYGHTGKHTALNGAVAWNNAHALTPFCIFDDGGTFCYKHEGRVL